MRAMMALVLHLGGVAECVRLIWEWSVHIQESGDLHTELRNDTELATECAVPAFGAGASRRALTPSAPASSVKIVWSDVASCT
jgi:hypothetical protein